MFYARTYLLIIFFAFLFCRCSNELDVTTPYVENTIVYGLLSPTDSFQYIKIYKAFIGDGNAYQYALQADSFYFENVLKVQLIKTKPGTLNDTILMRRDTLGPMTDGVFDYAPNVVYSTTVPIDIKSRYQLYITNLKTSSIITASTGIPETAKLLKPGQLNAKINLVSAPQYTISWQSGINAKVYNAEMRLYYDEISNGTVSPKFVDWSLGRKIAKDLYAKQIFDLIKNKESFYKNLETKLSIPDVNTYRLAGKIELIITGGGEDYYYYQKINNVTVGVNQNIPDFTNIVNGLGFFSAKTVTKWMFDLDDASHDYLRNGPYTNKLRFY